MTDLEVNQKRIILVYASSMDIMATPKQNFVAKNKATYCEVQKILKLRKRQKGKHHGFHLIFQSWLTQLHEKEQKQKQKHLVTKWELF